MALTAPTGAYRPASPRANEVAMYLPWLVDKAVRVGRDNGYGQIVDDALELILAEFGLRRPQGGFVDSDGVNAQGTRNGGYDADGYDTNGYNRQGLDREGFNRQGVNLDGHTREDAVATMVDGWDSEYAAQVLVALAERVA